MGSSFPRIRSINAAFKDRAKNVAIIVGHTHEKQGATAYNGQTEYLFNSQVAAYVLYETQKYKGIDVRLYGRDYVRSLGVAEKIKKDFKYECDLAISLHFNSYRKPVQGAEVLVCTPELDIKNRVKKINETVAGVLITNLCNDLGLTNRGVKQVPHDGRGFKLLWNYHTEGYAKTAMIIEPAFCNHKTKEAQTIIEHPRAYANALAKIICEDIYGLDKRNDLNN